MDWMDHYPELSLGSSSSFSESDESLPRKRKFQQNNNTINSTTKSSALSTMSSTPELQPKQNYLSDFHDLQFGRRYNNLSGNSTIIKKESSNNNSMHKHQKLDLELSLSNSDDDDERSSKSSEILEDVSRKSSPTSSNMVAMGCLKCNLLVMVSKSLPSCPNCKFVNSIPTNHYHHGKTPPRKVAKSLHTLSLLH